VAILREGEVVVSGAIRQLLRGDVLRTDIQVANANEALRKKVAEMGATVSERPDVTLIEVEGEAKVGEVLEAAIAAGAQVIEVTPRRETLEDLFLRRAL
jgi:ABC-2 type transport system ATP-binding protein